MIKVGIIGCGKITEVRHAPEYGWKYGYLFVGLLSLTCIAGIIIFFKRKKWF